MSLEQKDEEINKAAFLTRITVFTGSVWAPIQIILDKKIAFKIQFRYLYCMYLQNAVALFVSNIWILILTYFIQLL